MEALVESIRQKFEYVQSEIGQAAQSASRHAEDVRLVVVTKAQPIEIIQAVIGAGATILGENYPEETLPKIRAVHQTGAVAWHMIGHLQSRKASQVALHFDMLQSLDNLHLAEKLERILAEQDRYLPALLEVNVSGEETKYGFSGWDETQWHHLLPEFEQILALKHLGVRGLMTMPPLLDDPELSRPFFVRLRRLADYMGKRFGQEIFKELSMGTSADYRAAVQEGATYVRVGTAIVGPRPSMRA